MGETLIFQTKKTQILQGSFSELGPVVAGAGLRTGNPKPLPVWIDHRCADRVLGQFRLVVEAKLVQHVGPVGLTSSLRLKLAMILSSSLFYSACRDYVALRR